MILTEGEKDADAAAARFPDFVAVTSSGGANAAAATDWAPLRGLYLDLPPWGFHLFRMEAAE